ncbi:MAG: hypothetical protein M3Y30_06160, partial [Gemmatimonadota bacterium]|nr:hypothetical protein [Gemmatimonadota bacterium]
MNRLTATLKSIVTSRAAAIGVLVGAAYGLVARVLVTPNRITDGDFGVMTFGFLFVVPITIGYLTVHRMPAPSMQMRIFAPWITCSLVVLGSLLGGFEGSVCVVFASPVMLVLSSIGGIVAGSRAGQSQVTLPIALVLPWAVMGAESGSKLPVRIVTTSTSIEVAAAPSTIWPLVVSVDSIRPEERRPALFSTIGFPQPIAATLNHPRVG